MPDNWQISAAELRHAAPPGRGAAHEGAHPEEELREIPTDEPAAPIRVEDSHDPDRPRPFDSVHEALAKWKAENV